jgi:hypothetical protein
VNSLTLALLSDWFWARRLVFTFSHGLGVISFVTTDLSTGYGPSISATTCFNDPSHDPQPDHSGAGASIVSCFDAT